MTPSSGPRGQPVSRSAICGTTRQPGGQKNWATIAYMLGDDVQTVLDHYVRTNDAARRAVREKLSGL